ncbi:beta-galactosidase [Microbacterium alkaliflavum]|uniref:beta-galactosidase n=1 Tax=Microbacterium alkaliflavum TaxID=3248839 RepID=UPI0037CB9CBE
MTSTGWGATALRPHMANDEDTRPGLELSSHGLRRDGIPWIPVSGEIHYTRVPRERWADRVAQMRAGGISVVACYVPWLHHVPEQGRPRFDDRYDVAAFVDLVRTEGLDVVLRMGPWAHGEMRNGGYPDWVQRAPVAHRSNDPAYLALVREWWMQLAGALDGRCEPNTVLGIQLENELYDAPEHIARLKDLARECGLSAPFWTATAWGGAQLPDGEVFPLYGGYGDGFWVDPGEPWDATFRQHYFFSDIWDDPGIGADLRTTSLTTAGQAGAASPFPPATCELGGGMATAYHRRPLPAPADVAAIAHCKIGNGSAWQGYYMYVGGTNPAPAMQESHETGYPNDMPVLSYDFHAPIDESGRLAPSHAELRRQHAFLQAFGARLGDLPSHLPDLPADVTDATTLRWAFRGDGDGGFLFISWHQPHVPLDTYEGAAFDIAFDAGTRSLPSRPVDIPPGTMARWPVGLTVGGVPIEWLTATAVTVLAGDVPTLVVTEDAGIPVELAVPAGTSVDGVAPHDGLVGLRPDSAPVRLATAAGDALDVVVIPAARAQELWIVTDASSTARRVLLSADELTWTTDGAVTLKSASPEPIVEEYADGGFRSLPLVRTSAPAQSEALDARPGREAGAVPAEYGSFEGRPSAPDDATITKLAAEYELPLPHWAGDPDAVLEIGWAGDVGRFLVDDAPVADRFWDGSSWRVATADLGATESLRLQIVPLSPASRVHLPDDAARRLAASATPLMSVDRVVLSRRATWLESSGPEERGSL